MKLFLTTFFILTQLLFSLITFSAEDKYISLKFLNNSKNLEILNNRVEIRLIAANKWSKLCGNWRFYRSVPPTIQFRANHIDNDVKLKKVFENESEVEFSWAPGDCKYKLSELSFVVLNKSFPLNHSARDHNFGRTATVRLLNRKNKAKHSTSHSIKFIKREFSDYTTELHCDRSPCIIDVDLAKDNGFEIELVEQKEIEVME